MSANEKFMFPDYGGIHHVAKKVGETDFFLEKLKETDSWDEEYVYYFSAFVSAMRSITFTLQFVMCKYHGFADWYKSRQERLGKSRIAQLFKELRNHSEKTGIIPIARKSSITEGLFYETDQFFFPPNLKFKEIPKGDVLDLSQKCFVEILSVIAECYKDFDVYIDPRVLFTERGITALNWSIEDVEEYVGFPRGYTDMDYKDDAYSNAEIRLRSLRRYGGDETLQYYLDKYLL
jgi:hypothetical protein